VRRRFVCWNVRGIDADTRGAKEKERWRTRRREEKRRGMKGDAAVIIVLALSLLAGGPNVSETRLNSRLFSYAS